MTEARRIYVTGFSHPSGSVQSTVRTIRLAFPDLPITLAFSPTQGPIPLPCPFEEDSPNVTWEFVDLESQSREIEASLAAGALVLPMSPNETYRLAQTLAPHPRLLCPSPEALTQTSGPAAKVAEDLPVSVPEWAPLTAPVENLHALGRRHDWSLWMRASNGERRAIGHWNEFDSLRGEMAEQHGLEALFLQQRVEGTSLSVPFAAVEGTLLDAALVRPLPAQPDTYRVEEVPPDLHSALARCLETLEWTGGGTLRLIEDENETRWLDAWRPCFGDEVEGVARCGHNLPVQLISASTGIQAPSQSASNTHFCRTTVVRAAPAPPTRPVPSPERNQSPSPSPPALVSSTDQTFASDVAPDLDDALKDIVDDLPSNWATTKTPCPVLLPTRTQERFEAFTAAADRVKAAYDLESVRVGLSIKTNPAGRLLDTARTTGMLAETIHPDEMRLARRHGYDTSEIIVNGPVQALLPNLNSAPFALFGDAVKDLDDLPFDPAGTILGVRTRPPERGPSRFGVNLADPRRMSRFCEQVRSFPKETRVGLHFHAPASTLGHDRWWTCVRRVLRWAQTIQKRTGRAVQVLDLGGGWHPDDWLDVFIPGLLKRRDDVRDLLPELELLLLEPGKALSQPLGVIVSRVIDERPSRSEVILDASLAELSNIDYHPHRLLAHTSEHGWHRLPRGEGTLLGRLCMEADILGQARRVEHLSPGDTVVVCDAGAYDMSMTYPFGRGRTFAEGPVGKIPSS